MSGQIYVFSGPSGAGKSTIIRRLRGRISGLGYSVSHTSRARRSNEVNGVDYHFVDEGAFRMMIENGEFVEWAKVYDDLYGTSFSSLNDQIDKGLDLALDIDIQGSRNIKKHFKESVSTCVLPPSLETLETRLRDRGTDEDSVIDSRISRARDDIAGCLEYDFLIINDYLEKAVEEAESIIRADRCSRPRTIPKIREIFGI